MPAQLDIILFDGFELLDAAGPAEIFARACAGPRQGESGAGPAPLFGLSVYSLAGGGVASAQGFSVATLPIGQRRGGAGSVLLIPGGPGTRSLVDDAVFIEMILAQSLAASHVLTVCTGSALLARTGLLDGRQATTNKRAWDWAVSNGPCVKWRRLARWVVDGCFYTSSGVSAGMDMALGFIADAYGQGVAQEAASAIEYRWSPDPGDDPFSASESDD
jgi:putative intracellular protease/amidase